MSNLQYPVGKFEIKPGATHEQRQALIESIAQTPVRLRAAIANLSAKQLDEPYRPDGWTVRQVAHHLPDSHPGDFARTLKHPEIGTLSLDGLLQLYEWHGRHHVAHITSLRERKGW